MPLRYGIATRRVAASPVRVRGLAVRAIWSRFASPRAELVGSPSLSRPNLFAGD